MQVSARRVHTRVTVTVSCLRDSDNHLPPTSSSSIYPEKQLLHQRNSYHGTASEACLAEVKRTTVSYFASCGAIHASCGTVHQVLKRQQLSFHRLPFDENRS